MLLKQAFNPISNTGCLSLRLSCLLVKLIRQLPPLNIWPNYMIFWISYSETGRNLNCQVRRTLNPLNAELNPIRHLLALVGARHIVHVSRIRVNNRRIFSSIFQICIWAVRFSRGFHIILTLSLQWFADIHTVPHILANDITIKLTHTHIFQILLLNKKSATRATKGKLQRLEHNLPTTSVIDSGKKCTEEMLAQRH